MSANDSELFNVDINNYNGPLDVLLDLAKAQKVDLEEISITKLADQFYEYITNEKNLNLIDFYPFKSNSAKLAMTAHILFSKIDNKNVSTFSKKIINKIVRKKIGFKGILMSDDISMKALKYDLVTNAKKALAAGCNLVLYCDGNIKDNLKLIKSVPYIDKFTAKKTSEIYKILR